MKSLRVYAAIFLIGEVFFLPREAEKGQGMKSLGGVWGCGPIVPHPRSEPTKNRSEAEGDNCDSGRLLLWKQP